MLRYCCSKDTRPGRAPTKPAAAATFCVCTKNRSGINTMMDISHPLDQSTAWNMKYLVVLTTSSTAVILLDKGRLRVHSATCNVVQQSSWFQQENSVRTAGPQNTEDIWCHSIPDPIMIENAAAISVGIRHRNLQMAKHIKTNRWSTLLKSSVGRCHVPSTSVEESWPVSFAPSDESLDQQQFELE